LNRALSDSEVPAPPGAPANDERWELVQRIVASRFGKAPQLRDILLYISQRALANPLATIKEHEIGCNALGRKSDFNPSDDNIVRVQVSHLRKKLEEYFASDGKDELLRITIPKGCYMPRFEPRVPVSVPDEAIPPAPESVLPIALLNPRPFSWVPVLLVVSGVLAIACLYLALGQRGIHAANLTPGYAPPPDLFLSRLFGGRQSVGIVVSDTCLVMMQDILHSDVSVAGYLRRQYPEEMLRKESDPALRSALELIAARHYTSLADSNIASKLWGLSQQFADSRATIRYARDLNIRDFSSESFVLLGSRRGIPWVELFEPQLNFALEEDKLHHQFYFRNKQPKTNETLKYVPTGGGDTEETYADIALLPNLENTGSVLILSGITMAASEAAGDLVASSGFSGEVSRLLGRDAARNRYFELLLKTRTIAGAASNSQIVAYRMVPSSETVN
jgi:hypothetical protein